MNTAVQLRKPPVTARNDRPVSSVRSRGARPHRLPIEDVEPAADHDGRSDHRLVPRHVTEQQIAVEGGPEDREVAQRSQIGRASCCENECLYVEISVVAVYLKKKKK